MHRFSIFIGFYCVVVNVSLVPFVFIVICLNQIMFIDFTAAPEAAGSYPERVRKLVTALGSDIALEPRGLAPGFSGSFPEAIRKHSGSETFPAGRGPEGGPWGFFVFHSFY